LGRRRRILARIKQRNPQTTLTIENQDGKSAAVGRGVAKGWDFPLANMKGADPRIVRRTKRRVENVTSGEHEEGPLPTVSV